MSVTLEQVGALLELIAPISFAEEWDNSGFNVNLHNTDISGIMICLDVLPETIEEAAEKGCNLIISHHPLLFRATKKIDSESYEGKCVQMLAERRISLYCAHTSMDSAPGGINTWLADQFALANRCYIQNGLVERFYEVAVHTPRGHAETVRRAMTSAGAGRLGEYAECTFNIDGKGTFRPEHDASPYIGQAGRLETADEIRISSICSENDLQKVLRAVRKVHPYEMPAISVLKTDEPQRINSGLGIVGDMPSPLPAGEVMDKLKAALQTDSVRVAGNLKKKIRRLGVCGGAAGDFAELARKKGAELFITGEIKHNEYAAQNDIILVEAGHFDTEKCFCRLYAQGLQKRLDDVNYNIAIYVTNLRRPYVNY
ncbi:Nif3-like dinuclear metal center hexameric protein [Christensenella minuta]|uniref:Nif3-like dinuclear metal center hexameric protein n=1 Tax=Christensenella minuta TaxID=626937 RepID=UPI002A81AFD5|nr:Nif3-like dinuclear metal center hexameric protein [Christensenella minuta]MDY3751697.1 Nif3-like dinuclear metal center hexameric protein [Christensenella minuta]